MANLLYSDEVITKNYLVKNDILSPVQHWKIERLVNGLTTFQLFYVSNEIHGSILLLLVSFTYVIILHCCYYFCCWLFYPYYIVITV